MKKYTGVIVGVLVVLVFVLYYFLSGQGAQNPAATTVATVTTMGTDQTSDTTQAASYKDGTFTGPVADAVYGQLQIAVTISSGKITNVTWPVYPTASGHTTEVSQSALPQLKQEAIMSQGANVDIVSGATQTSEAFQQSLAAALAMAK